MHVHSFLRFTVATLLFSACGGSNTKKEIHQPSPVERPVHHNDEKAAVTKLTIIGTADVHGHIEMLPLFGGYLDILRSREDRAILLGDGGGVFRGTLASNLKEGAPIVEVYNLLKYDAVTIGNHEFDFGPVGADATATRPGQDPRGALKARAISAEFPFLSSNILTTEDQKPIAWPNVQPTTIVTSKGIRIGIIGVSTFETPKVTLAANIVGLSMAPLVSSIVRYAKELRESGAQVIVVAAHAGGHCISFHDPSDLGSCEEGHEIFSVAEGLPANTVDVIVAGHTHGGVAHIVNGIAIIESYSRSKSFGRIDLTLDENGNVKTTEVHPPRSICAAKKELGPNCDAGEYEGVAVQKNAEVAAIAAKAAKTAESIRSANLGIELVDTVRRSRGNASPLGNLFADLMLTAHPAADLSLVNGGSLRAELPKGPLHYGSLFEAAPFDNRFALLTIRGKELRKLIATNLQRDNGILSIAGMSITARCKSGSLSVTMVRNPRLSGRKKGKLVRDNDLITIVTSDFIASGGDGLIGPDAANVESNKIHGGPLIRDSMAAALSARGGTLDPSDLKLFDPKHPRIQYKGNRPLQCEN